MIYLLLVCLIIQLIYCYYVFDRDIFSPSAIVCEVFIMSTLACLYNISGSDYDIQPLTTGVIIGGNTVFIVVSTLIHSLFRKRNGITGLTGKREKLEYINVKNNILLCVFVIYLVFSVVFIAMNLSAIKNLGSGGDFSASMAAYRGEILEEGINLPGPLMKINVILETGVFVMVYIFINNVLIDKRKKSNYVLLFCVVLYLVSSVFTAQRTTILITFLFALFVSYSLLNRKYRFMRSINGKYLVRGLSAVVIFFLLFGSTRGLFGRSGDVTPIDNVMNYMGNSIELLDNYLRKPLDEKQFGEETFWKFRDILSQYGLADEPAKSSFLEFRQVTRGNRANVYTGYREYVHDYGLWAIVPFQAFLALFFGIWYEKISRRRLKKGVDLSFIIFAWFMAFGLFRFSIVNSCFTYMAYYALTTRWLMFLFWKWFFCLKITTKQKVSHGLPSIDAPSRQLADNSV